MFKALAQIFRAIFSLASACERGGNALDHLASIGEDEARALADQMKVEREARLTQLRADLREVGTLN